MKRDRVLLILSFFLIHTVWGATYLGIHYAVETIPPLVAAGLRHVIGGAALLTWCWLRSHRATAQQWRSSVILGILFFLIGHGALHWAEQTVPSGIAALLVATEPMWVAALGTMTPEGSRISAPAIVGLVVGSLAVAVLVGVPDFSDGAFLGAVAVIIGAFSWSVGIIYSRSAPVHPVPIMSAGMALLSGGVLLLATAAATGSSFHAASTSSRSAIALACLIVFGSLTFAAYCWLLPRFSPVLIATHTYTNPLIAVLLGAAIAGESVGPRVIFAAAGIVVAIVLVRIPARERSGRVVDFERRQPALEGARPDERVRAAGARLQSVEAGSQITRPTIRLAVEQPCE